MKPALALLAVALALPVAVTAAATLAVVSERGKRVRVETRLAEAEADAAAVLDALDRMAPRIQACANLRSDTVGATRMLLAAEAMQDEAQRTRQTRRTR